MARPSLRVNRRPKGAPARRSLTAASQPITDPATAFKSSINGTPNNTSWQDLAWDFLDRVGELRYYVGWRAASCARVPLIASSINDEGVPTGGIEEDDATGQKVAQIVRDMAGGRLGQSQLVKRATECLTVPGEAWVVILDPGAGNETTPSQWLALTKEEIKKDTRGQVTLTLPTGDKHEFDPAVDVMFRVWNPRPRKASEPDSPVRACLDSLHEIVRTTRTISHASKSRLIGNGVVFVPQEMSLPSWQSPVSANKPGIPVPPPIQGSPAVEQLQNLLYQVAKVAYDDEDSQAALIPIFATAPAEFIEKVQHLKFDNEVTTIAIQTRNDAISRLAMGLDVSPERLLGLGANSNHWSAWQIGDEDVQLHIAPVMETLCQAINASVLNKMLEAEGIDPNQYMVWYDTSRLTADPDKSDEAQQAFVAGAINGEAYREYLGLSADSGYDFESIEGWQKWAQDAVGRDPTLTPMLLPLLGPIKDLEITAPAAPQPAIEQGQGDPQAEEPASPNSEPNTEGDQPDSGAAVEHGAHVQLAIDLMVTRALELAGKRRRTHANAERLRAIPVHETHRAMGPVGSEQIPKLIAGWDTGLDELLERYHLDADTIRRSVKRVVARELTREVIDA